MFWLRSRILAFLQVLPAPEVAFARDLRGPSFLIPLLILGTAFTLLSVAQSPIHLQWARHQMESAGTASEQVSAAMDLMRRASVWSFVGVPLFLLAQWVLYALLLWLAAQVLLHLLEFQQALTIVAFSYLPILFRDCVVSLVLFLRSDEVLLRADGLNVALGLNLLFPQIPLPWSTLAASVNLFEVWFILLLVVGIAKMTRAQWQKALAVVFPCWIFVVLLKFAFVLMSTEILRSQGQL
jgi:hypothetical protein